MPAETSRATTADEDTTLVALLDELTAALRLGLQPDVEQVVRSHPALADDLRALWATVWIATRTLWNHARMTPSPRGSAALAMSFGTPVKL